MDSPPPDLKRKRDIDNVSEPDCSICLDVVSHEAPLRRSISKLVCGHEFHLDCIGSAFNTKRSMQCPNCRQVETPSMLRCSICAASSGSGSTARLQCGHEFHLRCVVSAFNAKGAMRCPSCGEVENGRWIRKQVDYNSVEYMEERRHLLRELAGLLETPIPRNIEALSDNGDNGDYVPERRRLTRGRRPLPRRRQMRPT